MAGGPSRPSIANPAVIRWRNLAPAPCGGQPVPGQFGRYYGQTIDYQDVKASTTFQYPSYVVSADSIFGVDAKGKAYACHRSERRAWRTGACCCDILAFVRRTFLH